MGLESQQQKGTVTLVSGTANCGGSILVPNVVKSLAKKDEVQASSYEKAEVGGFHSYQSPAWFTTAPRLISRARENSL